jgi:sugar phosphate permease
VTQLAEDAAKSDTHMHHRLIDAFKDGRVWLLRLIYFMLNISNYGYEMWGPSIIKGFSKSGDAIVGWLNAIPYLVSVVVMLVVGWHSDRSGERRWPLPPRRLDSSWPPASTRTPTSPWWRWY